MLYDAITRKQETDIPKRARLEWDEVTKGISDNEDGEIVSWILNKFDEVKVRDKRVQPAGWLGSGFDWNKTELEPIYRECSIQYSNLSEEEIQTKSGQIFGLYIILTLANETEDEWLYVKDDKYKSNGVSIKSRIYFRPN